MVGSELDRDALERDALERALDASEPQAVADAAVQLASALFETEVASLWWYRDDLEPRMVTREPPDWDDRELGSVHRARFRVDDLGRWELKLGWLGEPPRGEVPAEAVQRFVSQLDTTLLRATERKMREESHLELADNVAQSLVVAKTLLEMDDVEGARRAMDRALEHTKDVMARLQRDNPQVAFVRLYPSSVEAFALDEEE